LQPQCQLSFQFGDLLICLGDLLFGFGQLSVALDQLLPQPLILMA
jgi:hypothetical protein